MSFKLWHVLLQGDAVWDEVLQVKVVPVDLNFQKEVKGGPLEANKIIWVSVSKQLLSHGLALPARWVTLKTTSEPPFPYANKVVIIMLLLFSCLLHSTGFISITS